MMSLKKTCFPLLRLFMLSYLGMGLSTALADERPNLLWIIVEDMSCDFGYQGQHLVSTPHVDRLAEEGVVFRHAYVTAPVCSASRSAMITGMYQTTIGAHHHRSSRGKRKINLPRGIRTLPELFREAGYYTCNQGFSAVAPNRVANGKEDYNFMYTKSDLYDGSDWSERAEGQPFFAQIHLRGGKLRNVDRWYGEVSSGLDQLVAPESVVLPPYYPDHDIFRQDWASYLDSVNYTDKEVGLILKRLEAEGLLENTVIFFITDHGISQARGKQFLYDEGAKIPFVVWAPGRLPGGTVRDDLIVHIDMAATSLDFAGIEIPGSMQSQPLFGKDATARSHVVLARDRCDETVDRIRAVRRGDFKYIRNFHPERPYLQPCVYKDHKPFMPVLRELHALGRLNQAQSLHLAETRPVEELYDLRSDPFEIHNLADDPTHSERLREFRNVLASWETHSNDLGRFPESDAMYDSDMATYVGKLKRSKDQESRIELEENIALMKKWKSQGK